MEVGGNSIGFGVVGDGIDEVGGNDIVFGVVGDGIDEVGGSGSCCGIIVRVDASGSYRGG